MKEFFNKLTAAERRLVVFVGIAVFVVINIWFIIPMFGEFGRLNAKREAAQREIEKFQAEIKKKPFYDKEIRRLSSQGGEVASEEAALRLAQEVNAQAALSGVNFNSISPVNRASSTGKTNAFFEEASVNLNMANTGEKEFIDFLYRLAQNDLLIRAKSMNIHPDVPGRMRLEGTVSLVKSFQRKPPPKPAPTTPARATNAPAKAQPKAPPATATTATNKPKK